MLSPRRQARLRELRDTLDTRESEYNRNVREAREQLHREIVAAALDPDEETTQQELADLAGYTRERVTQLISDARKRSQ